MRPARLLLVGLVMALGAPAQDGKDLFARRCSGCHAVDRDKEGPRLGGVYGRQSGTSPGFPYSEALKKLNVRWNETSLDRWLTNPEAMAPGADMEFRLASAEERKAVIAHLRTLKRPD